MISDFGQFLSAADVVKADKKTYRKGPERKKPVKTGNAQGGSVTTGVKVGKGKGNVVRDANMKKLQQQANRIRKVHSYMNT
jgi:hypothetical protein